MINRTFTLTISAATAEEIEDAAEQLADACNDVANGLPTASIDMTDNAAAAEAFHASVRVHHFGAR